MDDLIELEQEVAERRVSIEPKPTPDTLVDAAFGEALVTTVREDKDLKDSIFNSAKKFVKNKANAIEQKAEQEDKETFFNNYKGACECFGYDETTTSKWAVRLMAWWHNAITLFWIILGCFTFAPITFVAKKITVIVKKSWIAFSIAIIIYLFVIVGIPLLTKYTGKIK